MSDQSGQSNNNNSCSKHNNSNIFLGLLDLGKCSVIYLDAKLVRLNRDDFCGFRNLPSDTIHFCTIAGAGNDKTNPHQVSTTVGYWFQDDASSSSSLVLKYDRYLEEMGECDEITKTNLLQSYRTLPPQRVVPYNQFLNDSQQAMWKKLTNFINTKLLMQRNIRLFEKVVPGSWENDIDQQPTNNDTCSSNKNDHQESSVLYPPIPVLSASPATTTTTTSHEGSRHFLKRLNASQRTVLLTSDSPADLVLEQCLQRYYDNVSDMLLGDLQLAFCMFVNLHCYRSLCHWRDLICMVCAVQDVSKYADLYQQFCSTLSFQLDSLDGDLLEDDSLENCLVPALQDLLRKVDESSLISSSVSALQDVVFKKYPSTRISTCEPMMIDHEDDDEEDEDGPVVVDIEDIEASLERTCTKLRSTISMVENTALKEELKDYPILRAAIQSNEDILMCCARALDNQNDVSLVREAAAYLENVEAKRV